MRRVHHHLYAIAATAVSAPPMKITRNTAETTMQAMRHQLRGSCFSSGSQAMAVDIIHRVQYLVPSFPSSCLLFPWLISSWFSSSWFYGSSKACPSLSAECCVLPQEAGPPRQSKTSFVRYHGISTYASSVRGSVGFIIAIAIWRSKVSILQGGSWLSWSGRQLRLRRWS